MGDSAPGRAPENPPPACELCGHPRVWLPDGITVVDGHRVRAWTPEHAPEQAGYCPGDRTGQEAGLAGPAHRRYAVTLPGPVGAHARPTVLLVHLSDDVAPGGGHVWTDASGQWRLHIDRDAATVLSAPAGHDEGRHPVLHAHPMP